MSSDQTDAADPDAGRMENWAKDAAHALRTYIVHLRASMPLDMCEATLEELDNFPETVTTSLKRWLYKIGQKGSKNVYKTLKKCKISKTAKMQKTSNFFS